MGAVYLLTLRQLAGRWRLLVMTALAALPVIISTLLLRTNRAPAVADFEAVVLGTLLAGAIAPLIVLSLAGPAFANEIEDRTLANLTLAPIPRSHIVMPKLLATITLAAPLIATSAFLTSHVAFLADLHASLAVTAAALIGVVLYAAAFLWLGLLSTQAIGLGLLYIVLWEGLFSRYVHGIRFLSIRHYWLALMHGLDERRFAAAQHLGVEAVSAVSAAVFLGLVLLSIRRLRRMDVP